MGASRSSSGPAPFVQLGYVTGAHGVRGAVRLKLFNVDSTTLAPGVKVRLCPREGDPSNAREVEVERVAPKPGSEMCRLWLEGIATREAADALRGSGLWVDRACLPAIDDDEFYLADLEGLRVLRRSLESGDEALGRVVGVSTNTAQALLVIELDGDEWLMPALAPFVVELALERGEILVDVDDAMLPERWQTRAEGREA